MAESRIAPQSIKLVGGALCLDFANTGYVLREYGDLVDWMLVAGALDEGQARGLRRVAAEDPKRAEAAFRRAERLRVRIRDMFTAVAHGKHPSERDLHGVSSLVTKSARFRRIHPLGGRYSWLWDDAERQLDWPAWIIARSSADLLTADHLNRVRLCAADDCGWLFVDSSRNHSRRWCDMSECGNRAKARRNYAKKRAEPL